MLCVAVTLRPATYSLTALLVAALGFMAEKHRNTGQHKGTPMQTFDSCLEERLCVSACFFLKSYVASGFLTEGFEDPSRQRIEATVNIKDSSAI